MLATLVETAPLRLYDFYADSIGLPDLGGVGLHLVSLERCVPVLGLLHDYLDPWEQEQARAIANRNRRVAFIASRALIRLALSEYCGKMVRPDAWNFATNPYGKLTLARANKRKLSFSISYAMSMLVIGLSESAQIGVDLEPIPDWTYADVTWDSLTERETLTLLSMPAADRYNAFLKIWTLKEAYTKCLGVGVSLDFRDIEVSFNPTRVEAKTSRAVLTLHQHEVAVGDRRFMLAVATRR
jgi:4'-phosphopantetheinyl transferase